jgi:hypothetical protein
MEMQLSPREASLLEVFRRLPPAKSTQRRLFAHVDYFRLADDPPSSQGKRYGVLRG